MFNKRSTFIQNLNNRKGQVALFVALIFQILFLFFAMIINVGLLVHHKVNLQNSVDLAAYYGAMRQAENMNAIAHVNYQIRQSWKLLAWRYRMLGSAGEWTRHPYDKMTRRLRSEPIPDAYSGSDAVLNDYLEAPSFCITYVPFSPMPKGENTCRDMATRSGIKLFQAPKFMAAHQAFSGSIRAATLAMQTDAMNRCKIFGSFNYLMLGKFVVAFNIDQAERMELIASLSRATSLAKDNFYDLDGQEAKVGIENTFVNNLTSANRSSVIKDKFKVFNSLGADGCNSTMAGPGQPATWLKPIRIYPGFNYIDTTCNNTLVQPVQKEFTAQNLPEHREFSPDLNSAINVLKDYVGWRENLNDNYNFSIGVEKNPWCMAYVGVSAETAPKIPFSPFGQIRLKARAFYKPFGGRMGPWYMSKWAPGAEFSSGGEKVDPLLPPRMTDLASLGTMNDPSNQRYRAANFSRFVGDKVGLQSYRALGYYGRAIYELSPQWQSSQIKSERELADGYNYDSSPNFAHWDHLPFEFTKSGGDILAWDSKENAPSRMRDLELTAVLPDAFDIAYYSIEPDFYHNYYLKMKNGYLSPSGPAKFGKEFRPDIGYHKGYEPLEKFSIRNQFEVLKQTGLNIPYKDQLTYMLTDWKSALTSWAPKNLTDYSLDTNRFGKCQVEPKGSDANSPTPPTSGNCVVGGSTGYSVKMVSSQYLRSSELFLGGDGGGSGPLRNPPPADDEF
ncbi:MAG: Tad domain-containing protein [Bdellovibrio sp.]|nr:Tad domain-containing protein [Bdellovibrio sp.]